MMYQDMIHELTNANPAGVEASMRLQYGVLDHLPRETFRQEARIAEACEAAEPGFLKRIAESFGMGADYEKWETGR
jgi:hypothetical protein